jgi:hypothetical protein
MRLALASCLAVACVQAVLPSKASARSHDASPRHGAAPAHAPAGPALVSGASAYAEPQSGAGGQAGGGESEPESAAASEDPLVRNGLGSPLCDLEGGELSSTAASNCETSSFVASAAPSEDFSFDTNIDTTFGVSVDALLQDYVVRPIWMALVWLVHAVLIALEWAYTLELLHGPLSSGLGSLLRSAEAQFTRPWLSGVLAFAAILAAYHGLVRRQVAQTLGEAAAMLAMIAAAMFVIADPSGTVGALSSLANEAGVGSLGTIADGSARRPYAALATGTQELYFATIEAPWCFLEFGNVAWCDQPGRLDPRLQGAASKIAAQIESQRSGGSGGVNAQVLAHRAQLLRSASTNGGIFLALPANGLLRNSVKEPISLLYVLCGGGGDATQCRGPTAAQAEFRANSGTLPRLAGVLVIALGVLGMLLLISFVALRLLEAAIASLLLLVLTPVAALAPAMGVSGRSGFRRWAGSLLGAVSAKLLWSILLGGLLESLRVILSLHGIGWLVQWLLTGALWWGLFLRRNELLGRHAAGSGPTPQGSAGRVARRIEKGAARHLTKYAERQSAQRRQKRLERASRRAERRPEEPPRQGAGATGIPGSARQADADERAGGTPDPAASEEYRKRTGQALEEEIERRERSDAQAPAGHDAWRAASPRLDQRGSEDALASLRAEPSPGTATDDSHQGHSEQPRKTPAADEGAVTRAAPWPEMEPRSTTASGGGRATAKRRATARRRVVEGAQERAPARSADGASPAPSPSEPGGAPRRSGAAGARSARASLDRERAIRRESARGPTPQDEDPVMRDARAVAERRKRQLGWSWRDEQ